MQARRSHRCSSYSSSSTELATVYMYNNRAYRSAMEWGRIGYVSDERTKFGK